MKFLLVGHSGCYNRGCEAILRSTLLMLRKEFSNPEITISSFNWQSDKLLNFGQNVKIIPSHCSKVWERFTWPWLLRQIYKMHFKKRDWVMEFLPIIPAIKKADVILSIGGDNYTMDYSFPDYFLRLNSIAKEKKKKLVIWGASIGPFPRGKVLEEIITSLKSADLITARETETVDYLKSIGVNENVRIVADPAFIMPSDTIVPDIIPHGISSKILGFNISALLSKYTNNIDNNTIIHECVMFLRKVIETYRMHVLLIPHVTYSNGQGNDYCFMEDIYNAFRDTGMISRVTPIYNAMQMKAIISRCNFFIGARTHSTIAALSTGVPAISLGYSLKSRGINKDIFGNYNFLLNINDFCADSLLNKFDQMIENELEIKRLLSEKVALMKALAWKNVTYLKQIV